MSLIASSISSNLSRLHSAPPYNFRSEDKVALRIPRLNNLIVPESKPIAALSLLPQDQIHLSKTATTIIEGFRLSGMSSKGYAEASLLKYGATFEQTQNSVAINAESILRSKAISNQNGNKATTSFASASKVQFTMSYRIEKIDPNADLSAFKLRLLSTTSPQTYKIALGKNDENDLFFSIDLTHLERFALTTDAASNANEITIKRNATSAGFMAFDYGDDGQKIYANANQVEAEAYLKNPLGIPLEIYGGPVPVSAVTYNANDPSPTQVNVRGFAKVSERHSAVHSIDAEGNIIKPGSGVKEAARVYVDIEANTQTTTASQTDIEIGNDEAVGSDQLRFISDAKETVKKTETAQAEQPIMHNLRIPSAIVAYGQLKSQTDVQLGKNLVDALIA